MKAKVRRPLGRPATKKAKTTAKAKGTLPTLSAKLIRIGNSRGIRLPKAVIEQAGLSENVQISVIGGQIILRSVECANPRAGWEEQIRKVIAEHGNELTDEDREWLDAPFNTEFDEKEWTW